jgi:hypothetical protein
VRHGISFCGFLVMIAVGLADPVVGEEKSKQCGAAGHMAIDALAAG